MSRVGRILHDLDWQKRQGCDDDGLIDGYTEIMVNAIMQADTIVEREALKSIGDVYLERGRAKKNSDDLSKASIVYKFSYKRHVSDASSNVAVQHRIKFARKLRKRVKSEKEKDKQNQTIRPYAELHLAGDSALQGGDLDAAEELFASALKQVHNRESPRLPEEEECLRKLGTVYVRRGTHTKDGQNFAKATALFNAAMARKGDKHLLIDSIKEAERLFLYHTVGIDCKPSPYETDIEHKNRLEKYRTEVKARLETIHKERNPYQYNEDDPVVKDVEMKRAESIRDLFKDISEQRKDFIKDLVEECIKTIGPPPCQYAMVGLGSQATELVTPYSDLEFAILIEENQDTPENKEYFLNLTCYLHMKISNLGETILPAVGIKSLNDFHSEDPADSWFYDFVTPRGFAFDGAMPWASKTPFGRERTRTKPAVSLIQTPAGMAEFQRHDIALSHGYHLSNVLRYVSYLTGDQSLVDDYMARVIQELDIFNEEGKTTVAVRFARASLNRVVEEAIDRKVIDKLLDVKKEIYRRPTVTIVNLGLLNGVYATNVWDVIKEMEETGVVTKENAHHLQVLVSISGELRLRTYLELGGQKENLSGLTAMRKQQDEDGEALVKSVFHVPDQKMLFRYYYTALPLEMCITGITRGFSGEFILDLLGLRAFYLASPMVKSDICLRLLQFKAATSHTEDALREVEEGKDAVARIWGSMGINAPSIKAILLKQKATSYHNLGDQRQAISCWEEELRLQHQLYGHDTKHVEIAQTYGNLGLAWESGDNFKAISFIEDALKMMEEVHGNNKEHPDIASLLGNLGPICRKAGQYTKSLQYHERALEINKGIHGQDAAHPAIAESLTRLAAAYEDLDDYAKAIQLYEDALNMVKTIQGANQTHPAVLMLLDKLEAVCNKVGDHEKARSYQEQAHTLSEAAKEKETPHDGSAK
ncbi:KLC4 [Branchiostoma lanceolatum]|uniref:KLC4 protein n=1 Tax=Branchiostoma lanceolatum TaxID=7740 RepID=A0A8K0AB80_BRALA|nr:KLC4 [Branchiostoma lanceolatum]